MPKSTITRRSILRGLPVAGFAVSTPALAAIATGEPSLADHVRELERIVTQDDQGVARLAVVRDPDTGAFRGVATVFTRVNPYPEPLLADDVTGTDAFAKWNAWEQANR